MKSEYSKWFWSECDELNKDTSFAHSLAEKAWNYRQTEVDALTLQVAEMKSRLNDAYTDGQSAMYTARQSKIDELQKDMEALQKLNSGNYVIVPKEPTQRMLNAGHVVMNPVKGSDVHSGTNQKRRECYKAMLRAYQEYGDQ